MCPGRRQEDIRKDEIMYDEMKQEVLMEENARSLHSQNRLMCVGNISGDYILSDKQKNALGHFCNHCDQSVGQYSIFFLYY